MRLLLMLVLTALVGCAAQTEAPSVWFPIDTFACPDRPEAQCYVDNDGDVRDYHSHADR